MVRQLAAQPRERSLPRQLGRRHGLLRGGRGHQAGRNTLLAPGARHPGEADDPAVNSEPRHLLFCRN